MWKTSDTKNNITKFETKTVYSKPRPRPKRQFWSTDQDQTTLLISDHFICTNARRNVTCTLYTYRWYLFWYTLISAYHYYATTKRKYVIFVYVADKSGCSLNPAYLLVVRLCVRNNSSEYNSDELRWHLNAICRPILMANIPDEKATGPKGHEARFSLDNITSPDHVLTFIPYCFISLHCRSICVCIEMRSAISLLNDWWRWWCNATKYCQ